ncbi:exported hypothetical protein [Vibrio chagasii]|nr:exported hypothetical protein [Vibrio chagasii]
MLFTNKVWVLLAPLMLMTSASRAEQPDALDMYIDSQLSSYHLIERAKSVRAALDRIQSENWWDNNNVFNSISQELNHVVNCYYHVTTGDSVAIDLLDEIEFLVASDEEKKKLYHRFTQRDLISPHESVSEVDCF